MSIRRQLYPAALLGTALCVLSVTTSDRLARASETIEFHPLNSAKQGQALKPTATQNTTVIIDISYTNSPNLRLSARLDSIGRFQLVGTNVNWAGSYLVILRSSDLMSWESIGAAYGSPSDNLEILGTGFIFTDTGSAGPSQRFYKIVDHFLNQITPP